MNSFNKNSELADELSRERHAAAMAIADSWHPTRMRDLHLGYASSSRGHVPSYVPRVPRSPRRRQRGGALRSILIVLTVGLIATLSLV